MAKSLCQLFFVTYNEKRRNVKNDTGNKDDTTDLRCPECRALLKRRRSRTPDKCEMVCGGCGKSFDACDLETLDALKKGLKRDYFKSSSMASNSSGRSMGLVNVLCAPNILAKCK